MNAHANVVGLPLRFGPLGMLPGWENLQAEVSGGRPGDQAARWSGFFEFPASRRTGLSIATS
jgi:hypothetical protein